MSSAQLKKMATVTPAKIEWRDGLPFSTEFNDVYFSVHGAIDESQHVFIEGNQLLHDWKKINQKQFYIAELGFGSGLNFLNTAHHWKQHLSQAKTSAYLNYIAIEKHPFILSDLIKTCALWPELSEFSEKLINNYPSQTYGRHQILFKQWNLSLTLILMPVEDALSDLIDESEYQQHKTKIDHWYLDGFAPTKNTSMWGSKVANKIARLSKVGTRLATYTVAGMVKRPLVDAGFVITKKKGFAKKREMLTAKLATVFSSTSPTKFINLKHQKPWLNISLTKSFAPTRENKIAIIGAGIAGCTLAYSLTQKGFCCELFETNSKIAQQASGAAAGIFHPQLTSDMNIGSQFNWQAYLVLLNFLSDLGSQEKHDIILSSGVERLLKNEILAKNLIDLSQSIGLTKWIKPGRLFSNNKRSITFPHSAAIDMSAFCKLLINKIPDGRLLIRSDTEVLDLQRDKGKWTLLTETSQSNYSQVVFCGGANSKLLDKLNISRANISRGQTCNFQSEKLAQEIKHTLMESIYLVPGKNNQFLLGTTFENFVDDELNQASQIDMLNRSTQLLQELSLPYLTPDEIDSVELNGSVGYRLHSKDRMPLVGPAVDKEKLLRDFTHLGQTRLCRGSISYYNLPGLWINTAYGSHGLLFSLLSSHHLVSLMTNNISPLSTTLSQAIHPVRFMVQKLKNRR